ncbi:NIPSNAP family protein, partial [Mesorhizobium sp. VK2D]|nr:NIPSNAP family protein [Mesorhizobium sp. VK2D]
MDLVRKETSSRLASPIVELRQYTLRPGQRETLIALFDREFIESQE